MYSWIVFIAPALTTGPTCVEASQAGPRRSASTAGFSLATKASYTAASTMAREQAEHFCPWKP